MIVRISLAINVKITRHSKSRHLEHMIRGIWSVTIRTVRTGRSRIVNKCSEKMQWGRLDQYGPTIWLRKHADANAWIDEAVRQSTEHGEWSSKITILDFKNFLVHPALKFYDRTFPFVLHKTTYTRRRSCVKIVLVSWWKYPLGQSIVVRDYCRIAAESLKNKMK